MDGILNQAIFKRKSEKNLAVPFNLYGAVPFGLVDKILAEANLQSYRYNAVFYRLFGYLDFEETERINGSDYLTGWTCCFANETLASKFGGCRKSVQDALNDFVRAGLLKRRKGKKNCYRYRIMLYKDALDVIRKSPKRTIKVEYIQSDDLEGNIELHYKTTTKQNPSRKQRWENYSEAWENYSHNQEFSRERENPPPSSPTQQPKPAEQREEGTHESHNSTKLPTTPTETPAPEVKDSQGEKTPALFLSESLSLADQFAGSRAEYVHSSLRNKRAKQLRIPLIEMFRAPTVADLYPDQAQRTAACVEVMRVWICIVKSRERPAEQIGFINTDPGLDALAEAQARVFKLEKERQRWAKGETGRPRHKPKLSSAQNARARFSLDEAINQYEDGDFLKATLQRVKASGGKPAPVN